MSERRHSMNAGGDAERKGRLLLWLVVLGGMLLMGLLDLWLIA
jgi:hypothetical protein